MRACGTKRVCAYSTAATQAKNSKDGRAREKQTKIINRYVVRNGEGKLVANPKDPYFKELVRKSETKTYAENNEGVL